MSSSSPPTALEDPVEGKLYRRAFAALDRLQGSAEEGPLGLAVSGGSDSMALLQLASAWAKKSGRMLCVATVDHGLRPAAADEVAFVAAACAGLEVDHDVLTWRPPAGGVSQSQARRARHRLLADWARRRGVVRLATGHTADDRLETFLMRARAGSGWYGLAAPEDISPSPAWPEGRDLRLIRPMLEFSRAELQRYLVGDDCAWREDPSNKDVAYERVRMRALIAGLPQSRRTSMQTAIARLQALRAARRRQILRLAQDAVAWRSDGVATIVVDALASAPEEVATRMMQILALVASGGETPAPLDSVEALLRRLRGGAAAATLGGAWVRAQNDFWHVARAPEGDAKTPSAVFSQPLSLAPGERKIWDGRFLVGLGRTMSGGDVMSYDAARRLGLETGRPAPANPEQRAAPVLVAGGELYAADFDGRRGFFAEALQRKRFETLVS